MLDYTKFFSLLKEQGIKQIDLRMRGVHPRTFQKLQNGELIRSDTINQLCALLNCQPGDIMEYVPDEPETDKGQGGILHSGDDIADGKSC